MTHPKRISVTVLLALLTLTLCACSSGLAPSPRVEGGCTAENSPYLAVDRANEDARISYCEGGDGWTGVVRTGPYPSGTSSIAIRLAGYPSQPGLELALVSTDRSVRETVHVPDIAESWETRLLHVPKSLAEHALFIEITDESTANRGWAGIALPRATLVSDIALSALNLLLVILLAHLWTTWLGAQLPSWQPALGRPATAILALGGFSIIAFSAWCFSPKVGRVVSLLLLAIPFAGVLHSSRRDVIQQWVCLNRRFLPAVTLAFFVLWIGLFPFDWNGDRWHVPASRWISLPVDNWIPLVFAQMLGSGEIRQPMIGDWLSSDRPPLQTGLYLLFLPTRFTTEGLFYQALATWAQCLVLVPLSALAAWLIPSSKDRWLAILAVAMSSTVLLNALFVWPKLISAAYCAIYCAAIFSRPAQPRVAVTGGVAAAMAMLAHGGALFVLIGLTLAALLIRRASALKAALTTGPLALCLYAPWIAYQKFVDPPGDRLAKWHFAGQIEPVDRPFGAVVSEAYASLTLPQWWTGRLTNLERISEGWVGFIRDAHAVVSESAVHASNSGASAALLNNSFFNLFHATWFLGPLAIAVGVLLLLARQRAFPRRSLSLALAALLTIVVWSVLMFSPGSTVIHQGAYLLPILITLIAASVTNAACPWLFRTLALTNISLALVVYVFDRPGALLMQPGVYVSGAILALVATMLALATPLLRDEMIETPKK